MTKEQLNNTEDPLGFDPPYTLKQAIQAINRLMWSDGVEDDDQADAEVVKSFLVNDNMQEIAQAKVYKDRVSKIIPVMETSIEGAQKRIEDAIEDYADRCKFIGDPRETNPDLEYIGIFLDSVGDEMAAMTSAYDSMHDRYVQALAEIEQLKAQGRIDKATINASLSSIHSANDNR